MKIQHFFYGLAVIVVLFMGCERENKDYRSKWVGHWDFTTIEHEELWTGHENDSGQIFITKIDTIRYIGTIETHETNRLKIVFKPDAKEPEPQHRPHGLIYPIVDEVGNLTYPELEEWYTGHCFLSNDSIVIRYGMAAHAGSYSHRIQGIKINKK